MIINNEHIPILMSSLSSFIDFNEEYNIPFTLYSSSEFEDFHTGFSTDDAENLIVQLSNEDYNISDNHINYIYNIILTYKDIINFGIIHGEEPPETVVRLKEDRKLINSLIRSIKSHSSDNNIELYIFEDSDEDDKLIL